MTIARNINRKIRKPYVINANDPRGMGVCDGCGWWVNYVDLKKHMQFRGGTSPVWDGLLVCATCDDVPNPAPQFSRLTLFPDPVPFQNPRPEQQTNSGYGYWVDDSGNYINTVNSNDTWGGEYVQTIANPVHP